MPFRPLWHSALHTVFSNIFSMQSIYETPREAFLRCAFPRGRMLSEMEDELTIFAQLIASNSGKEKNEFERSFDDAYAAIHHLSAKTIKNRRTEMTRLFGLVIETAEGMVEPSPRTLNLIEKQDFRLFFKTICNKFQFPNCINKFQETKKQLEAGVHFKPGKFILQLMKLGVDRFGYEFTITGQEISNLIFNDLDVTAGRTEAGAVFERMIALRKDGVMFEGGSLISQHGREFLGYMTLAGLLVTDEGGHRFLLNRNESAAIEAVIKDDGFFEFPSTYLTSLEERRRIQNEWEYWYGELTQMEIQKFATTESAYSFRLDEGGEAWVPAVSLPAAQREPVTDAELAGPTGQSLKETGDIGERIVLTFERRRIAKVRPDKLALVRIVSNDSSLGFDIQSVELADFSRKRLIEVKTTKRTFAPSSEVVTFFPMSSNEWDAAKLYGESYYIYRVFLTSKDAQIYIVKNPAEKETRGLVILEPSQFRVLLKHEAIDEKHAHEMTTQI